MKLPLLALTLLALGGGLLLPPAFGQVPQLVNYQGRVAVGNPAVNFDGSGQFKFALVSADGSVTYWSNDNTSTGGAQPTAAVVLPVSKGLYSVLLGNTAIANMSSAIPASVWANADVRLRVWFNDGSNGFQLLTPDQRLAPGGYLSDATVTNTKLASDAASLTKVSAGTITSSGGRVFVPNGVIQRGGTAVPTVNDLGLYSQTSGAWMRFVTNGAQFAWFTDSGGGTTARMTLSAAGALTVGGEITANVVTILGGSDVAEPYEVANAGEVAPKPGLVVSIDPAQVGQMRVTARAYDKTVAGILSGANGIAPGITLRQKGTVADGTYPVASIGRVWCWCDAEANGAIEAGDMLTTSDTPGHAMRVTDHAPANGATIGKAMSALRSGKGLVLVLVSLK